MFESVVAALTGSADAGGDGARNAPGGMLARRMRRAVGGADSVGPTAPESITEPESNELIRTAAASSVT